MLTAKLTAISLPPGRTIDEEHDPYAFYPDAEQAARIGDLFREVDENNAADAAEQRKPAH